MDEAPAPSFLRRTKSKSMRGRESASRISDDDQGDSDDVTSVATLRQRQKKAKAKPKARLSFGVDEEDVADDFKVKKSNLSRKLKLGSTPGSLSSSRMNVDDAISLDSSTSSIKYSKEYLSELKASTPSKPSKQRTASLYDSDSTLDVEELAGATVVDESVDMDIVPEIPSESSIMAAKQKRERLRGANSVDDGFISLSVARREDTHQGPHPDSRLVREDDELGEGDDEFAEYTSAQERIALGKKAKKKESEKKKLSMQEMIEDAEEEDEETLEWEREQLRRGTKRTDIETTNAVQQEYRPAPIPPTSSLPSLEPAISRLSVSLVQLTESHAKNTTSMSSLGDERQSLEVKEKELRSMVEKAEQKRSWFYSFREWVETVATFLDEKYPDLEKLEDEHISLLKERKELICRRRNDDDQDDLSLCMGSVEAHDSSIQIDDMGRIIPQQNNVILRRERMQSRARRRAGRTQSVEQEGYSTDTSLPASDQADYETALSKLSDDTIKLLGDVKSDEFKNPSVGVAKWFGNWRQNFSDSYIEAFGGLGLVSAWEFWVRLEMLAWDPLEDSRVLDSFRWYKSLYDYSRPDSGEGIDSDETLGPDGDLVSAMISTAVVPRLCKILRGGGCDVYSARHMRSLIDLAEQVEASATREKFESLIKAVIDNFQEALESAEQVLEPFIKQKQIQFEPESIPARRRFLMRRLKLVSNLIKWRKHIGECFGVGELLEKIVTRIMLPVARTGWDVGGNEIVLMVSNILPRDIRIDLSGA